MPIPLAATSEPSRTARCCCGIRPRRRPLGSRLGAIPTAMLGRIAAAWVAKRAGLKPPEIEQYSDAADDSEEADT